MERFILLFCLSAFSLTVNPGRDLNVESYAVEFTIRNAGIKVAGTFADLETTIKFDPDNLSGSSIVASVPVATIKTGIELRDKHLMGREYFFADKFPNLSMRCKEFRAAGKNRFLGQFEITMRDITRTVEVPFTYQRKGEVVSLKATFPLNRREFAVGTESMILSDVVDVSIKVNGHISRVQ